MPDKYFRNAGTSWNDTNNWSLSSGGAGGGGVPSSGDNVFFDANSGNCSIDVNAVCNNLDVSAYANTLTQTGSFTLTLSGLFDQDSGSFVGGTGGIFVNKTFTRTGGTFTSTSGQLMIEENIIDTGGTFNHNNGLVYIRPKYSASADELTINTNKTYYQVRINSHGQRGLGITGTMIVSDNLYVTGYSYGQRGLTYGNIECKKDIIIEANGSFNGRFIDGEGKFILNGTVDQSIIGLAGNYDQSRFANVEINKPTSGLILQNVVMCGRDWNVINLQSLTDTNAELYFYVRYSLSAATMSTITPGSLDYTNISVDQSGSGDFAISGTINLKGLLKRVKRSYSGSGFYGGAINLTGNVKTQIGVGAVGGAGTTVMTWSGTSDQYIDAPDGGVPCQNVVNKTSGQLKLVQNSKMTSSSQTLTLNAGEINLGQYNLDMLGDYVQNGGTYITSDGLLKAGNVYINSGTFNEGSQGVTFTQNTFYVSALASFNRHPAGNINTTTGVSPTANIDFNGHEITNLTHNRGAFSLNIVSPPVVKGNIYFNGSGAQITSTSQTMEVHGNIYSNGMRGGDETILNINGDTDQEIVQQATTGSVSDRAIVSIHINKPAGRLYLRSTVGNLNFDRDFINNIGDRVVIDGDFETRFTDNSSSGAAQMKSGGIKFPNFVWERGAQDMTLQDDLKTGNYKRISGSYGSSWINSAGKTIEIYGNYSVVGDASQGSGVVHNLRPNMKMVGPGDHTMSTTDPQGNIDAGNWIIAKDDGASVTIDTNVLHDNDSSDDEVNVFLVKSGTLFVKDVDLLIEGILSIDKAAKVYKTDLATVTATSGIIGEIGDSAVLPVPPVEEEEETLADIIKENLKNPFRVKGDNGEVEQHRLRDQIEAEKYLASKEAFKNNTGLKFSRLKPGGTTS